MMDRVGCVSRDDRGRRMHWTIRRRTGWMAVIMEEVELVWKLGMEVIWWLVGGAEVGGGDNASMSRRVLGGTNPGRPASTS
jgi:hypothetical protein